MPRGERRPAQHAAPGRRLEIVWFDRGNRVIQHWYDFDRDGRADRVVFHRHGRPWRVLRYR